MRSEGIVRKHSRSADTRDVMIRLGGAAIIAGVVSGKPKLRKYLAGSGLLLLAGAMAPDFIRYMKIESM